MVQAPVGAQGATYNILYTGVALAGCTTSLRIVAADFDPTPSQQELQLAPREVRWRGYAMRLMQEYYSNLYVPRLIDALQEQPTTLRSKLGGYDGAAHWNRLVPGWRALAGFFRYVQGAVFIIDSQRERIEACKERIEKFERTIEDAGRRPSDVAIVFQLNKRDLSNALDVATLKDTLRWSGPVAYVESVAPKTFGVSEALQTLVDLMRVSSAAAPA